MNTIGDRVKALRKKARLTQEELGDKVNRSYGAIASIERNATAPEDVLHALAAYFKVDIKWLLTGEGEEPQGLIVPLKAVSDSPWRDETLAFLKAENQRLWKLVEKLSGAPAGSIANFKQAVGKAGKLRNLLPAAQAA